MMADKSKKDLINNFLELPEPSLEEKVLHNLFDAFNKEFSKTIDREFYKGYKLLTDKKG